MTRKHEIKLMLNCIYSPDTRANHFSLFRNLSFGSNLYTDRYLRQLVHDMKLAGYPVISTGRGYCRATKHNEPVFLESQAQLLSRIAELKKVQLAQAKMYARIKGQKSF